LDGNTRCLDVAIGMRPDLLGKGFGDDFARAVVEHAHAVAGGRALRCVVAEWNKPGLRAAEASGFVVSGDHDVEPGQPGRRYIVLSQSPRTQAS
jgi:RimJ/RimL family protein N-acetyltransferase